MFARCFMLLAIASGFAASSAIGADEQAQARALVDAAIEAAGGRDALAKYRQPFYCEYDLALALPQGRTAHATYPTKTTEYLNGYKFSETRVVKLEFLDSVDKGTFEKP